MRMTRIRKLLARLGYHELLILAPLLVIIAGTWGFVAVAGEVAEGDTLRFDEWAVRSLRRADNQAIPIGPPALMGVARDITALGSVAVLVFIIGVVCGYLGLVRKFRTLVLVLVASTGGLALSTLLKHAVHRDRPSIVPHLADASGLSFPSGHSTLSAVVYLTLGALLARTATSKSVKAYLIAVALVLAFLVGASRVYLGVHYPTDVLAGWTLGLVWAVLCLLVAYSIRRRGVTE